MARPKGTPKTGGRKKGTPNRTTKMMRQWLTNFVRKNRRTMQSDLDALEPKDRLIILEKLMGYVIPKQQAVKAEISSLTDDEIISVVDNLLNKIDDDNNINARP